MLSLYWNQPEVGEISVGEAWTALQWMQSTLLKGLEMVTWVEESHQIHHYAR